MDIDASKWSVDGEVRVRKGLYNRNDLLGWLMVSQWLIRGE